MIVLCGYRSAGDDILVNCRSRWARGKILSLFFKFVVDKGGLELNFYHYYH